MTRNLTDYSNFYIIIQIWAEARKESFKFIELSQEKE